MTANTFATFPLAVITPSRTNPRRHFRDDKMYDLVQPIKASGVLQPILVRPLPADRLEETFRDRTVGQLLPTHEIIAGERRYRAATLAELTEIPCAIRDMTDGEVLEAQLVENLQRADLSELEEAEGYDTLMAHSAINADRVAEKIGKSRSYVYSRLKLLDLCPAAKEGLRQGHIDHTRALLIARIPDTQLQEKALAEAASKTGQGELVHSTRGFTTWLQQNVMLPLDKAPFQITDARLVKDAGSCKDCPKRTGAAPDIFQDVLGADICIDPPCYHRKADAHLGALQAKAEALGATLLHGREVAALCSADSDVVKGYSPLTQERHDTASGQPATLAQLLKDDMPETVLIENPHTRALVHAVETAGVETFLLASGLVKRTQGTTGKKAAAPAKSSVKERLERAASNINRAADREYRVAAMTEIRAQLHALNKEIWAYDELMDFVTPKLLRAWVTSQVDYVNEKDMAQVLGMQPPEPGYDSLKVNEAHRLHIAAMPGRELAIALLGLLIEADYPCYREEADYFKAPSLEALADGRDLSIDLAKLQDQARQAARAEYAEELEALQAEAAAARKAEKAAAKKPEAKEEQVDLPLDPAAQASGVRGAKAKTKTGAKTGATPAGAARAKTRLSAAQAQESIAAAMQDAYPDAGSAVVGEEGAPAAGQDAIPDACGVGDERPTAEALPASEAQSVGASAEKLEEAHSDAGLLQRALELIRAEGKVSVRMLKQGLGIGTSKAMALVDQLEAAGHVSACKEGGVRTVLAGGAKA